MADIADVLAELESLRSEFGQKLDGTGGRLEDVTNAMVALRAKWLKLNRMCLNTLNISKKRRGA